jgi:hypothetical protein
MTKATKQIVKAPGDVKFTAQDLNDTIARYRQMSAEEMRLARVLDEINEYDSGTTYGRLQPVAQGPNSPTD